MKVSSCYCVRHPIPFSSFESMKMYSAACLGVNSSSLMLVLIRYTMCLNPYSFIFNRLLNSLNFWSMLR